MERAAGVDHERSIASCDPVLLGRLGTTSTGSLYRSTANKRRIERKGLSHRAQAGFDLDFALTWAISGRIDEPRRREREGCCARPALIARLDSK